MGGEITRREVFLKVLEFCINREFSELHSNVRPDLFVRQECMAMVATLKASVLSHRTIEKKIDVQFEHPSTWWQMFKDRYMPEWFKERFPVVMGMMVKTVKFEEYDTYPRASVDLPKEKFGEPFIYQTWTSSHE